MKETCTWMLFYDGECFPYPPSECGEGFQSFQKEDGFTYCPFCGKPITFVPDDVDDEDQT